MTSRSHNTVRKVAARAVPAFLVAGLGLSLQAIPAMAEMSTVIASDLNQNGDVATSGAVTGFDIDMDQVAQHDTLQEALRKSYNYISVNEDLNENIKTTANPEWTEDTADDHWYTDEIVMNGHELKGIGNNAPTVYNDGMLEFRNAHNEQDYGATGNATELVIYNGPEGYIDTYDIDVTGTIENNGSLDIYDGTYKGTINNRAGSFESPESSTPGGSISFNGGDFTQCTIVNENDEWMVSATGGTFSSSLSKDDMKKMLNASSCAKQNDDDTWTVYNIDDESTKLGLGQYIINPSQKAYITEDNIIEGARIYRTADDEYMVAQDEMQEGTVCFISRDNGTTTAELEFTSIQAAIEAAEAGETIQLCANIETDEPIVVPNGVSINGCGHNLKLTADTDREAFITVDGNNPAVGYTECTKIWYLNVDAGKHCDAVVLLDDCEKDVTIDQCQILEAVEYGITVDSSRLIATDNDIFPGAYSIAGIRYRKGGKLWGSVDDYGGSGAASQASFHIEPEDLEKIRVDANAERKTVLNTPQQAACWLDAMNFISYNIYYWPGDQHAENRYDPSVGKEQNQTIYVNPTTHGTVKPYPAMANAPTYPEITPDPGYKIGSVSVVDMYGNPVETHGADAASGYGFFVPYGGVTMTVTFVPDSTPTPDPTPKPDPVEDVEIPETEGGKVEVEPVEAGETATVVAEPDAGQEVRDVIVTDPEGNEIDVTVDKDGNYTFEMPEGGATVEVVFGCDGGDLCASHSFGDVTHDDWFHDTVDWAVDEGIFHGYDNGTFGPNDTLTREQAATVMYNYFGGTTGSGSAGMSDVGNDWYTDAVNWAVENGIMTGYSGTDKFGIGDALSREQFCSVIAKAMGADLSDADLSVLDRFTDAGSVSEWAKPAVAWAVENGLMNGVENADGTRSLQGIRDMTRAEMAAMMKNAVDAGVLTK